MNLIIKNLIFIIIYNIIDKIFIKLNFIKEKINFDNDIKFIIINLIITSIIFFYLNKYLKENDIY